MASAAKIFDSLFKDLKPREREVIEGRFGLGRGSEPETLAAIGKRYGITRERVRQIEASAMKDLKEKLNENSACLDLIQSAKKQLKIFDGVAKKETLLASLKSFEGINENHLSFLTEVSQAFHFYPEDGSFWAFYFLDKNAKETALNFVDQLVKLLRKEKEAVLAQGYNKIFKTVVSRERLTEGRAENFQSISKKFHANAYGDFGLTEWPEIRPRAIRDQIYLVLNKKKEPLHFEAITDFINKSGFTSRKALVPTVHNELIKDERFVLVGRGIYALSEHGYKPGTVQEVIKRLIKRNGPMKPKEVLEAVMKERILKPNTILINLQNKSFFERLGSGAYRIRES